MLSQQGDICSHALIESAAVIPSGITNALIGPAFGCSYPLIRQKQFAKMQFSQLRIRNDLFDDYYHDTCAIQKSDMIAFLKSNTSYRIKDSIKNCSADVHIYYGEKENRIIKQSAKIISGVFPLNPPVELPGLYHGEFSLNHPRDYVSAIWDITGKY